MRSPCYAFQWKHVKAYDVGKCDDEPLWNYILCLDSKWALSVLTISAKKGHCRCLSTNSRSSLSLNCVSRLKSWRDEMGVIGSCHFVHQILCTSWQFCRGFFALAICHRRFSSTCIVLAWCLDLFFKLSFCKWSFHGFLYYMTDYRSRLCKASDASVVYLLQLGTFDAACFYCLARGIYHIIWACMRQILHQRIWTEKRRWVHTLASKQTIINRFKPDLIDRETLICCASRQQIMHRNLSCLMRAWS